MPPALFDVLDHCPQTKVWKTRPPEPDLAGLRDRALLLVGFFAALRRSEPANLLVEEINAHDRAGPHPAAIENEPARRGARARRAPTRRAPGAGRTARSPAVQTWMDTAGIANGPVFRKISRGNRVLDHALHPESINDLVQAAIGRAGLQGGPFSAHSLRAGFVTFAHLRGASDRAIAHQTRHRSPATLGAYVRIAESIGGKNFIDDAPAVQGFGAVAAGGHDELARSAGSCALNEALCAAECWWSARRSPRSGRTQRLERR